MAEKIYTIPLRRQLVKSDRVKRGKRSVSLIRSYLIRHTKAEDVKISQSLNDLIWMRGAKKPPAKVRVKVRIEEGKAFAMLPDEVAFEKKAEKGKVGKLTERFLKRKEKEEKAAKEKAPAKEAKPEKDEAAKPEASAPEEKKEEPQPIKT